MVYASCNSITKLITVTSLVLYITMVVNLRLLSKSPAEVFLCTNIHLLVSVNTMHNLFVLSVLQHGTPCSEVTLT